MFNTTKKWLVFYTLPIFIYTISCRNKKTKLHFLKFNIQKHFEKCKSSDWQLTTMLYALLITQPNVKANKRIPITVKHRGLHIQLPYSFFHFYNIFWWRLLIVYYNLVLIILHLYNHMANNLIFFLLTLEHDLED